MEIDTTEKIASLAKTDDDKIVKAGKDYIGEAKKKILDIINKLLIATTKFAPEQVVKEIDTYLQTNGTKGRIIYSEISSFIFALTDDQIGCLLTNIEKLLAYALSKTDKSNVNDSIEDRCKFIIKLYDHCNLANHQKNMASEIEGQAEEVLIEQVNKFKTDVDKQADKIDKIGKEIKRKEVQYITILGIFATIVLSFVGGLAFSTSVLQNLKDITIFRLLITIILLAFVLITVIYLLAQFIFKINNKKMIMWPIILFDLICLALFVGTIVVFNFCPWIVKGI